MYANFVIVVAVVSGIGVICAALIALYRMARKIDEAMNRKCPCETVEDLQETAKEQAQQMEKRKQQIEEQRRLGQEMDKRLSVVEAEMRGVRAETRTLNGDL